MDYRYSCSWLTFYFVINILYVHSTNLIKNGDFETYSNYSLNYGQPLQEFYGQFPSNFSEWYNKDMVNLIEVKTKIMYPTTTGSDLSTDMPIYLCQKLQLKPFRKYQIKYSGFSDICQQKLNFSVQANNHLISYLYIDKNATFSNQIDYFYPSEVINQICFSEVHQITVDYQSVWWMFGVGGLLDNVSLIQAHLQNLTFSVKVNQNISKIFLISSIYNLDYLDQFTKQVTLFVSGVKTENLQYVSDMTFVIEANITSSFHDSEIELLSSGREDINPLVYFHTEIIASGKEFYSLSEKEKKVLLVAQNLFSIVSTSVKTFTKSMQAVVCSYFIVQILNFDLLLLLYVFLDIGIFPEFAREIYYEFLQQYFSTNSIFWILSKLGLVQSQTVITMNEQQERIPELVLKQLNNQRWLGWYGVSSQVFNNNVDSFFQLLLLVFKIALAKFFLSCVSAESRKKHKLNFRAGMVFVVEIISCIPCFVLSAMPCILESASKIQQIWEKVAQVLLLFVCFFVLALYMLGKRRKSNLNEKQIKNCLKKDSHESKYFDKQGKIFTNKRKNKKNKKIYRQYQYNQVTDLLPGIFIPLLISLQSPKLFLLLNTFVVIIRVSNFAYFGLRMIKKQFFQTFFQLLINLVWIVHQILFLIFYSLDLDSSASSQKIVLFGISAVLTVVVGFFLSSLNILISIIKLIFKIIKSVFKYLLNKRAKSKQKTEFSLKSNARNKQKEQKQLRKEKMIKSEYKKAQQNCELINQTKNKTTKKQGKHSKESKIKVKVKIRGQKKYANTKELKIIEDLYVVEQMGKKR